MTDQSSSQLGLPRVDYPVVGQDGILTAVWRDFFRRISFGKGRPFQSIEVTPTPGVYTATQVGHVLISGGTVSAIRLIRGTDAIDIANTGFVPVAIADRVEVDYLALPVMTFVPAPGT